MTQSWSSSQYTFITGCPRSGTSVLKKILRGHPRIAVPGIEHGYLLELVDRYGVMAPSITVALDAFEGHHWAYDKGLTPRTSDDWGQPLDQPIEWGMFYRRLHALQISPDDHDVLVLQYPGPGILRWRDLQDLFPGARVVSLERDPRANVSSQLAAFDTSRSTARSVRLWQQCIRAAEEAEPHIQLRRISYETLVTDTTTEFEALCQFMGTDFSSALLSFEVSMPDISTDRSVERRNFTSLDATFSNKWKTGLRPDQIWLVEILARSEMNRYGHDRSEVRFRPSFVLPIAMDLAALIQARWPNAACRLNPLRRRTRDL